MDTLVYYVISLVCATIIFYLCCQGVTFVMSRINNKYSNTVERVVKATLYISVAVIMISILIYIFTR